MKNFIIKKPENPKGKWNLFIRWLNDKTASSCSGETLTHYGIANHELIAQYSQRVSLGHYNLSEQPPVISLDYWYENISGMAANVRNILEKQLTESGQFDIVRRHPRFSTALQTVELVDEDVALVNNYIFNSKGTVLQNVFTERWEYTMKNIQLTDKID